MPGQPKPKPKRTRKRQQTPPPIQAANTEINQHLDGLKKQLEKGEISQTEYDSQVANWQRGQVLLNSIAVELGGPTQSAADIAAATASPMISYKIGQYFKSKNTEGPSAHILAHAVLGAVAGDNNALAVAISAGGAEAAVPVISTWLYGEIDGSALMSEQKETVSAITNLSEQQRVRRLTIAARMPHKAA